MQVRKQQLELDMEQQTGSKYGRRALDSAGQNRIKEKQCFVFLSECVYSQREAKS